MRAWWNHLPALVRGVVAGGLLGAAGTLPWAAMAGANIKHFPQLPWAMVPTAVLLWIYWRFVRTRSDARVNALSAEVWGAALLAGFAGLIAVLLLQIVMARMVHLPQQDTAGIAGLPFITLAGLLLASAAVSGIVEETAFRGVMQRPIEQRHGPVIAILVTGSLFGLAHFTHPEVTLILLPYYIAVAAVYGALAWLTDSVLPSMALHAFGNLWTAMDLFTRGRSEWQATATPRPLVWETGLDEGFVFSVLGFLVVTGLAVAAYRALWTLTRERR